MESRVICGQGFVLTAHGGRLFRGGRLLVALKIEKVVEIMESTMSEQLKLTPRRKNLAARTRILDFYRTSQSNSEMVSTQLTKSRTCSFSVAASAFSRICSSLKVGLLMALRSLGGAPGDLRALFSGLRIAVAGVGGGRYFLSVSSSISTDSWEILCRYPKPTSAGCG